MTESDLPLISFQVLRDLPEPVFWFDETGKFLDVNARATEVWGYSREEFLQMTIFDVNANMKPAMWSEHWRKKQVDPSTFEAVHRKKDGSLFPVDITDKFIHVDDKVYCYAIVRDISERTTKNRIARLSKFTLENIEEAIFWIESTGVIQNANQHAIDRYGFSLDEFKSMSIRSLYEDMDQTRFESFWQRLKNDKTIISESIHITKEGKKIDVEVSANYIKFEDVEFSASIVRDITDRKRKEAAIRGAFTEIRELKEKLEAENSYLYEEIEIKNNVADIITTNAAYLEVLSQVEKVAHTDTTVLISGESGSGKELLARAVHKLSPRSESPLIHINCGSIPHGYIESELFGHKKGAFLGAITDKVGKFEIANGGTVFLDEIGDLPFEFQSKLFRVIDEGVYEVLGSNIENQSDVRVIASSSKDLKKEIDRDNFREDLYFRLNVFPIITVPLRERSEDIPLLVRHFSTKIGDRIGKKITEIPIKVIDQLEKYDFPGNVRELQNLVERGVITSVNGKLNLADINLKKKTDIPHVFTSLKDLERSYIIDVLKHTNWKVSGNGGAAKILDLRPTTLFSKMERLNIKRSSEAEI